MWYSARKVEMESKETEMVSRFQEKGKVKLSELPLLWVGE